MNGNGWTPQEIKDLRTMACLSQEAFARELGVSLRAVQHWESGEKKPEKLARRALDEFKYKLETGRKIFFRESEIIKHIISPFMKAKYCLNHRYTDATEPMLQSIEFIEQRIGECRK